MISVNKQNWKTHVRPTGVHVHILRNAVEKRARGRAYHLNDFIDTTFLWSKAAKLSFAERTCVAIFFLRCPNEHVTS